MLNRHGDCNQCGECCKTVNITAVRDLTLSQHGGSLKELELYLSYRGIRIVGEDEKRNLLFYSIDIPCRQLGSDNQCLVHNTPGQPVLCYRYPQEPTGIRECSYTFSKDLPVVWERGAANEKAAQIKMD